MAPHGVDAALALCLARIPSKSTRSRRRPGSPPLKIGARNIVLSRKLCAAADARLGFDPSRLSFLPHDAAGVDREMCVCERAGCVGGWREKLMPTTGTGDTAGAGKKPTGQKFKVSWTGRVGGVNEQLRRWWQSVA